MSHDQRIEVLISLKLSGEATPEELEELEGFVKADPELTERIEKIKKIWNHFGRRNSGLGKETLDDHLSRLNKENSTPAFLQVAEADFQLKKQAPKRYAMWSLVAAASVLLFWFFYRTTEHAELKPINNTVSTKLGDKANINLPDGSKVWLNGGSKITYVEDFQSKTRQVYLSGEAFFDVAKDKTKPFIIHTRTINLKVLGTAFNVRSYDYEKETETSLVHGSIELTLRNRPDQKIFLKPGEKLLVKNNPPDSLSRNKVQKPDEETPIVVLTNMHYYGADSSSVETSWTKNHLIFNDEPLDKIALNLERWFNVRVTIVNESLKKVKYTATIEEDDKLEDFLEALKLTEGLRYSIKNKEVILSR